MAQNYNSGARNKNFSLILCSEWEKQGSQAFLDLAGLIRCGVPQILRTIVWGDLLKASVICLEERKQLIRTYASKFNKQASTFENFVDLSQKYDSIAFRQID